MKRQTYNKPELQLEAYRLEYLLAESDDASGSDIPIDDVDLTFIF